MTIPGGLSRNPIFALAIEPFKVTNSQQGPVTQRPASWPVGERGNPIGELTDILDQQPHPLLDLLFQLVDPILGFASYVLNIPKGHFVVF